MKKAHAANLDRLEPMVRRKAVSVMPVPRLDVRSNVRQHFACWGAAWRLSQNSNTDPNRVTPRGWTTNVRTSKVKVFQSLPLVIKQDLGGFSAT
jgi:hypothetical protein